MKAYSALEVRRRFGEILDEAAAGERIVIERAGMPVAGLVPLADLEEHDPERRKLRQLDAIRRAAELGRRYERRHGRPDEDVASMIRRMRDERAARIAGMLDDASRSREGT